MNQAPPLHRPWRLALPRPDFIQLSLLITLVFLVASWFFVLELDREQAQPFFSLETWDRATSFLSDLAGVGQAGTPAFAQASEWAAAGRLAYHTLVMSVLAIAIAAVGALATFMFGARNVMAGDMGRGGLWAGRGIFAIVRAFFTLTRAIPELIWAMLLVFVFTPGILPGAVALGVHNLGILGKLSSEVVEDMDMKPARALQASGAGRLQVLLYGVLPQALPRFVTYLLYRWEVIIRTSIVVGFVAAGGLGMEFRLSMSHFHYTTVALLLMWYLILVVGVDLTAAGLRRLAR